LSRQDEHGGEIGSGKKTIVSDLDEAGGKVVEEEATDELLMRQRYLLAVLGGEGHAIVVDRLEDVAWTCSASRSGHSSLWDNPPCHAVSGSGSNGAKNNQLGGRADSTFRLVR
jgi:hypothetical protein